MVQYLLNLTCIWLLSLAAFRVFLHKGNFHGYNRIYLVLTFLTGLVLPLITFPSLQAGENTIIPTTIRHLSVSGGAPIAMNTSLAHTHPTTHWHWLTLIYAVGLTIMAIRLLANSAKLIIYYRSGKHSKLNQISILETGRDHAPFSLLSMVFVSDKQRYDNDEWHMLLAHEQRHYTLMHFPELLLMQLATVVLWFHPLVHLYRYQLSLIHEYQADAIPNCKPPAYARFLIEQSMLHTAPIMAHSLTHNPIKERIDMLVHKAASGSAYRMLISVPLMAVCLFGFTKSAHSDKPIKSGNTCHYKGNTIEFQAPQLPDSYQHRDEVTGEVSRKPISWPTPPIKLNGGEIYVHAHSKNITPSLAASANEGLLPYLIRESRTAFEQLDDGDYAILLNDVLIDTKGNITWYENHGVIKIGGASFRHKKETEQKIDELLANAPPFSPAMLNGLPVPYLIESPDMNNPGTENTCHVSVRNHKILRNITAHLK